MSTKRQRSNRDESDSNTGGKPTEGNGPGGGQTRPEADKDARQPHSGRDTQNNPDDQSNQNA